MLWHLDLILLKPWNHGSLMALQEELRHERRQPLRMNKLQDVDFFLKSVPSLFMPLKALHALLVPPGVVKAA